ncbi:MAG: glycerol-3-phosphate 1-O-acyltransferase PlsY [Eubacteriales bacterium]|nr:glycerol-3-phosphate 1-O-acyltransferase PlsY [Eubacteriales bacterium]
MERVVCLLIGYVCGLFQTSYLIGKKNHIDIRDYGSGNAGTTNAMRVMGKKAGVLTLLGDCLKCVIAMVVVSILFGKNHADMQLLLRMYAGAGCILGHNFPFYLHFKGGKGIAASIGLLIGLDWKLLLCAAVVFITIFTLTHYVSLCSISAYVIAWIAMVIFGKMGYYSLAESHLTEMYILMAVLMLLAVWRHKDNIVRLLHGEENRLYLTKK